MPPKTRSKSSSKQTGHQDPSVLVQNTNVLTILWCYFDKSVYRDPNIIKISDPALHLQECQGLFASAIEQHCHIKITAAKVRFWKPKERVEAQMAATEEWWNGIADLKDIATRLTLTGKLYKAVEDTINDDECIHLFVTADDLGVATGDPGPDVATSEARDVVTSLPEFDRFVGSLGRMKRAPSRGAKSSEYVYVQIDPKDVVYDGRSPHGGNSTVAPPLTIFHPIFEYFIRRLDDRGIRPTFRDLAHTRELITLSSTIYLGETDREQMLHKVLSPLLGYAIHLAQNKNKTSADGVIACEHDGVRVNIMIMELKRELGESGCDASTQAGLSMSQYWRENDTVHAIRDRCGCPMLMLAGGGPWLSVLGGAFTDKYVVQRLTHMMWIGHPSTHEEDQVVQLARVFVALRETLAMLQKFYRYIIINQSQIPRIDIRRPQPHPRLYPYPCSFMENQQSVEFDYVRALEDDPACIAFQAKTRGQNPQDVVVKFVSQYGDSVHKFLAGYDYAPRLRYFGPLPDRLEWPIPSLREAKAEVDAVHRRRLPLMKMVVMDYVEMGKEPEPSVARQQILDALTKLHDRGFVFGDLRPPNVLFDKAGKLKLIDFDWAGEYERDAQGNPIAVVDFKYEASYARYPSGLSSIISWPFDAKDFTRILPQHDKFMLDQIYPAQQDDSGDGDGDYLYM